MGRSLSPTLITSLIHLFLSSAIHLPRQSMIFYFCSLGEALRSVLHHGSDLLDSNALALEFVAELDIFDEAVEVIALEVGRELLQESFHV